MKNQYFADRRDLFKYDLLLDLVESHGGHRLTSIPMLTPNDDSGEGRLTQADSCGHRPVVFDFLKNSIAAGERDIRRLREFMPTLGVAFMAYRDDAWFVHEDRRDYFDALPAEYLKQSVIFFDPDIGLETGTLSYIWGKGPDKYLLYSELAGTWDRASDDSAVVIYQHLQKNDKKRPGDIQRRLSEVSGRLRSVAFAVRKHDLAFIVAAKDNDCAGRFRIVLQQYARRHDLAFSEAAAQHGLAADGGWCNPGPARLKPRVR